MNDFKRPWGSNKPPPVLAAACPQLRWTQPHTQTSLITAGLGSDSLKRRWKANVWMTTDQRKWQFTKKAQILTQQGFKLNNNKRNPNQYDYEVLNKKTIISSKMYNNECWCGYEDLHDLHDCLTGVFFLESNWTTHKSLRDVQIRESGTPEICPSTNAIIKLSRVSRKPHAHPGLRHANEGLGKPISFLLCSLLLLLFGQQQQKSCVWLFCSPRDCSPPGSSNRGIF